MIATAPKTRETNQPRKAPMEALRELLADATPELVFDAANPAGVIASLTNRPGRYDLRLAGGTPEARKALAEAASLTAKTSIDLGVETDEIDGELMAMATRLHLSPAETVVETNAIVLEIGTIFQSWSVDLDAPAATEKA